MARFFFDTEFLDGGLHEPLRLVSIGIVAEDGREYYAECAETDLANPWVKDNVLPHLTGPRKPAAEIRADILAMVGNRASEWLAYYAYYDWVLFCGLMGGVVNLPACIPFLCLDLKQAAHLYDVPHESFPRQGGAIHNALNDARWNLAVYRHLKARGVPL